MDKQLLPTVLVGDDSIINMSVGEGVKKTDEFNGERYLLLSEQAKNQQNQH